MSLRFLAACGFAAVFALGVAHAADLSPRSARPVPVHSRFKLLQQDFRSGPDVTKACLACHKESARQIHKTQHWKWEYVNPAGQLLGKRHVVNNFCTSTTTNLA